MRLCSLLLTSSVVMCVAACGASVDPASTPDTGAVTTDTGAVTTDGAVASDGGVITTDGATTDAAKPEGQKLSAMSDSELGAYCKSSMTTYTTAFTAAEMQRIGCAFSGIFGAKDAKTDVEAQRRCKEDYDACLASPSTPGEPEPTDCTNFVKSARTCGDLTTAELNACLYEQLAAMKPYAAPTFCSTIKAGEKGELSTPSCDLAEKKCPALFSDSAAGGP